MEFDFFLLGVSVLMGANGFLTEDVDFTSPHVFDPVFYTNTNSDIHGVNTIEEAKHHWLTIGIRQGKQASGSFHSKQYLKRYADLKSLGNNYRDAISHYLTKGLSEKRLGYLEGGGEDRWTISSPNHSLFISASKRTAGAIDSVVWNNKEFINSWDHGRELQIAVNTQPYAECFNPTEGGGRDDGRGDSSSKLLHISAEGATLHTRNHPAYWLRHGDKESQPLTPECGHNAPSLAKETVYNYDFSKTVSIGCAGLHNCFKFVSNITIGGHWPDGYRGLNLEAPTGYLAADFYVLNNYDPKTKRLSTFASHHTPVIMNTKDEKYAMGIFVPTGQNTDAQFYGAHTYSKAFNSGTSKWGVGFRKKPFPDNTVHHLVYTTYICVGSQHMVMECMDKVYKTYPHI